MKKIGLVTVLILLAAPCSQAQSLFEMANALKGLKTAAEQQGNTAQPQAQQSAQQQPQSATPSSLDNLMKQSGADQKPTQATKPLDMSIEETISAYESDLVKELAIGSLNSEIAYRYTKMTQKQSFAINAFEEKFGEWLDNRCRKFYSNYLTSFPSLVYPVGVFNEPVDQDFINSTNRLNKKNESFLRSNVSDPNNPDYKLCEGKSPKEVVDLLLKHAQALQPQYVKLAAQAVEDKKKSDLIAQQKKAEEQKQANAKAEQERAKDAARLAELKSGKVKPTTYDDFALLYNPKDGDRIVASPLVQADKGYYKMTAHLSKTDGDKWFFSVDKMGSVEKPKVMVVEQRSNVYTTRQAGGGGYETKVVGKSYFQMEKTSATTIDGQMRVNGFYGVVGQYVDNAKIRLTNGTEDTIPVFKLTYVKAL